MAITECGKGHVYDTDQYATCPYCNGGRNIIDFNYNEADGDVGKTVIPGQTAPQQTYAVNYAVTPNDAEKTVAPESYRKRAEEENKTVGVFKAKYNLDPVVGWLVCIDGPEKGKDYRLWAKINTIGRSDKMDVSIKKEKTISTDNHARLAYDPKHNNFQLIPAESTNNIYVNDEPTYTPIKLNAYDVIELGNSKFIFVPLCSSRFTWEDGVIKSED
ncbi:MAG: FHA domain-containing protein [Ruminococcus sp.]|nr:FHA domain-containing protein [Ruminococcus sp.]